MSPCPRVSVSWLRTDSGVYFRVMEKISERGAKKRPAVFLDRDGTLIDDIGYLADPDELSFYPGIPKALRRLQDEGQIIVAGRGGKEELIV